jgi:hypothetical protein
MSIALIDSSTSASRKSKSRIKNPQPPPRARNSSPKSPTSRLPHSPISSKKLAANRRNSQKSTGPRTPSGKKQSSQNATKHALCSQSPRLPNECSPTYNTFVQELRESLRPTHPLQKELFHQITSILWRLQRANETENQLYALRQKNNDPPCLTLAKEFHKNPTANPFLLYSRYERHLRNTYLRLIRELKKIQKEDADAAEHFRRTEPAWSPEKRAAQIARFNNQPQPEPDESNIDEDYQERWSAPSSNKVEPIESIADTDWYKEMTNKWRERDRQRLLERHRKENQRIEQEAAHSSPSASLDVGRWTLNVPPPAPSLRNKIPHSTSRPLQSTPTIQPHRGLRTTLQSTRPPLPLRRSMFDVQCSMFNLPPQKTKPPKPSPLPPNPLPRPHNRHFLPQ